MNIQIFGKNKCFDTKKAQRWFKERGIKFQMIDLAQKGMSKGELDSVLKAVGGLDNLLDQKSKSYASLAYLAYDEDKKEKLLEDGTLMKTPIVRNGRQATVGYQPDVWEQWEYLLQAVLCLRTAFSVSVVRFSALYKIFLGKCCHLAKYTLFLYLLFDKLCSIIRSGIDLCF